MAITTNPTLIKRYQHTHDEFIAAVLEIEADDARELVKGQHMDGQSFYTECEIPGMSFGLGEADDNDVANWIYPDALTSVSLRIIRLNEDGEPGVAGAFVHYTMNNMIDGLDTWYYPSIGNASNLYAVDFIFTVEDDPIDYDGRIYPNGE